MNFLSKIFSFFKKEFKSSTNDNVSKETIEDTTKTKFYLNEREGILTENFYVKYHNKIIKMEDNIYKEREKIYSIYNFDDRVKQYKSSIEELLKFKNFCFSHGKGGQLYFVDTWEHCHNSHTPDFSILENLYSELKNLESNKEFFIIEFENKKKSKKLKDLKVNLKNDLLELIENNPGIFQKDIYKIYHNDLKNSIQSILCKMAKEESIIRIKQGNTYKLYLNSPK